MKVKIHFFLHQQQFFPKLCIVIKGRTSLTRSLHLPPFKELRGVARLQTHTHTQTVILTYSEKGISLDLCTLKYKMEDGGEGFKTPENMHDITNERPPFQRHLIFL